MGYNSDNFELTNWKLTLPVSGSSTKALEVKTLIGYEQTKYFYDASDRAMVFRADANGATTSGSTYARSELREMNGSQLAWWTLKEGGTMSGTLKIDEVPVKSQGSDGRLIFAQIHGTSEELLRMYWEKDTVYFMNERSGVKNQEAMFTFANAKGEPPSISRGEIFSYLIDVQGDTMSVQIFADGQTYLSTSKLNTVWQSDSFYFKAGVYLGVNASSGSGSGQVSYYGLDFSHAETGGLGGLKDPLGLGHIPSTEPTTPVTPTPNPDPVITPPDNHGGTAPTPGDTGSNHGAQDIVGTGVRDSIKGTSGNDRIFGLTGNDLLKAGAGNDIIYGGDGDDTIEGNDGNDIIVGGSGADRLKGGSGADTFVMGSTSDAADTISDFRSDDKLDLGKIFAGSGVSNAQQALASGLLELRDVATGVEVWVKLDGTATKVVTMTKIGSDDVEVSQISVTANAANADHSNGGSTVGLPTSTDGQTGNHPIINSNGTAPATGAIIGLNADDIISGKASADYIYGLSGNDKIKGNGGNDIIYGGAGNDRLEGNGGKDTIFGGTGNDWMKGGEDADHFVFAKRDGVDTLDQFRAEDSLILDHSRFVSKADAINAIVQLDGNRFFLQYSDTDSLTFTGTTLDHLKNATWDFDASEYNA